MREANASFGPYGDTTVITMAAKRAVRGSEKCLSKGVYGFTIIKTNVSFSIKLATVRLKRSKPKLGTSQVLES